MTPQQHPSGQVVSVRLPPDIVRMLDSLADRTQRSRGFYIREALLEALPKLEERYWAHQVAQGQRHERDTYTAIIQGIHDDTQPTPRAEEI